MSEPSCINLAERFGRRYRVSWEADGATKPQWPREDWPWLMEIRCRYGVIYPEGGEILQAMTDRPRLGAKLRALPCVLSTRGDLETVVTFHVDDAPAVFRLLKPYRRRQVSGAERERLAAVGERFRFRLGHGVESNDSGLESTNDGKDRPRAGGRDSVRTRAKTRAVDCAGAADHQEGEQKDDPETRCVVEQLLRT